jgi:hypothetical protein
MGDDSLEETNVNSDAYDELDSRVGSSASQVSQSTGALISGNQETNRIHRVAPPPLIRHRRPPYPASRAVAIALAIAIPVSLLCGVLIALAFLNL